MKRLLIFVLMLMLCSTAAATKIHSTAEDKLGSSYAGTAGSSQGESVYADMVLAQTDLDASLVDTISLLGMKGLGTGSVFYVDSAVSDSEGTSWATAVATIDDAVNLCTADRGDYILVASTHVEDLGLEDPKVDIAGVTIIGLGNGENRPVLSYDDSTDSFCINADDVAVYNLVFLAHTPDVVVAIDVNTDW